MRTGVGTTPTILVIVRSIGEEPAELRACRRRGAAGTLALAGAPASAWRPLASDDVQGVPESPSSVDH